MPRFAIHVFLTCILLFAIGVRAQTKSVQPDRIVYDSFLARLKSGDKNIDFAVLRKAYSETADASPYGTSYETRRRMNAAVVQLRCDEAMKIADQALETNYLSPDTHIAKSNCYRAAGDTSKSDFHKAVYLGLINSVLASGDGLKPESAYAVISIEEEYAVMRALGFTVWKQEQFRRGEHSFELLYGTNDKAGQSIGVYFNIDVPTTLERRKSQK